MLRCYLKPVDAQSVRFYDYLHQNRFKTINAGLLEKTYYIEQRFVCFSTWLYVNQETNDGLAMKLFHLTLLTLKCLKIHVFANITIKWKPCCQRCC
jgi:hypothetical protein